VDGEKFTLENKISAPDGDTMKKLTPFLILAVLSSCGTCKGKFEPVIVPGWTDECNAMATIGKMEYYDEEKKLAALAIPFCFKSIKRKDCRRQHFGVNKETGIINPVNYGAAAKYRDYTQCMAEKD